MENSEEILRGVIYNTMGDRGPEAKFYYPKSDFFDPAKLSLIAVKTVTLLTGEEGRIPKGISIITFAKYQLLGIIFHFEVRNESFRGNFIDSNITVLFNEKYSSIAYKYSEQFESLLREVSKEIIENEIAENQQKIELLVQELYVKLLKNLASLKKGEEKALKRLPERKPDFRLKIVVIGDANVGKTTMLLKYIDNSFQETYLPTIGINISNKKVSFDEFNILLNFYDIAGQEKFELIRRVFYEGLNGTLIVYDVTNENSFKNLEKWITEISSEFPSKSPIGIIIGNKIDLRSQRIVEKEAGEDFAREHNLGYIEVSAKTGENINEVFTKLARLIIENEKITT